MARPQRTPQRGAALATQGVTAPQDGCGAARGVGTGARQARAHTRPTVDCARAWNAENNAHNPLTGVVCLLTKGVLIRVRQAHPIALWADLLPYSPPLACLREP
jgi:hypothetical protein